MSSVDFRSLFYTISIDAHWIATGSKSKFILAFLDFPIRNLYLNYFILRLPNLFIPYNLSMHQVVSEPKKSCEIVTEEGESAAATNGITGEKI